MSLVLAIMVVLALVSLCAALWAYWPAIGGDVPHGKVPAWLTEKPFAHRGYCFDAQHPENSLAAFVAAADAGHPMELDVHLTKDGQVVVVHDDDLARLSGDPRRVDEVTLAELRQLHILGSDQTFPTLAEVLSAVDGRTAMLVEMKNRGRVGPLEDLVAEQLSAYRGNAAVVSFNPVSLGRFANQAPKIARGQLSGTFRGDGLPWWETFALRHLLVNWASRPTFIAYELSALPCWDASLQRALGRKVIAWTAKTPADVKRALEVADGVIADPGALG